MDEEYCSMCGGAGGWYFTDLDGTTYDVKCDKCGGTGLSDDC